MTFTYREPVDGDEDDDPLFNSTREYVEQVNRYKEHQGKPTESVRKPYTFRPVTCVICGKSFEASKPNARRP